MMRMSPSAVGSTIETMAKHIDVWSDNLFSAIHTVYPMPPRSTREEPTE
jgi:hypothetical protein